ncbi:hypothetical protein O9K51_00017 [Purpureocillium lavendulum]|uniref:Uncharacterized protein n=1 Tax=Purpureocillium lavendulum TaxID=1247861 RepID=A0AB34G0R3_9HYPO|nr:hypothetical protein O9K51_00017 [Purpureocillium lavendulum]
MSLQWDMAPWGFNSICMRWQDLLESSAPDAQRARPDVSFRQGSSQDIGPALDTWTALRPRMM